jgi:hypothetical protein
MFRDYILVVRVSFAEVTCPPEFTFTYIKRRAVRAGVYISANCGAWA